MVQACRNLCRGQKILATVQERRGKLTTLLPLVLLSYGSQMVSITASSTTSKHLDERHANICQSIMISMMRILITNIKTSFLSCMMWVYTFFATLSMTKVEPIAFYITRHFQSKPLFLHSSSLQFKSEKSSVQETIHVNIIMQIQIIQAIDQHVALFVLKIYNQKIVLF